MFAEKSLAEYNDNPFFPWGLLAKFTIPVIPSQAPGYSSQMKPESLEAYEFPGGSVWKKLLSEGKFKQ